MLPEHLLEMTRILNGYDGDNGAVRVVDIGSFDVNGSFRSLVEARGWAYTGVDLVPGKNVDVVSLDPYDYPLDRNVWDIVMSGSTMEHVPEIWRWLPALAQLLRPGGMLAIITHTQYAYHPHPVDCWRIMPDGMRTLFDHTRRLERYDIQMFSDRDISGVAWRIAA